MRSDLKESSPQGRVAIADDDCGQAPMRREGSTEPPLPLPGIRAWLGAFKVASVLAAVGFIAKIAHEQMLGIQLTDWSVLDLSLFAGRWVVDSLTTILATLAQSHYLGLIWIFLALSPALAMIYAQDYPRVLRGARMMGIGMAAVALGFVIVHDEVPTLSLSNWLTADLPNLASPLHGGRRGAREETLRYAYFISKTNVEKSQFDAMRAAARAAIAPGSGSQDPLAQAAKLDELSQEAANLFPAQVLKKTIAASDALEEIDLAYNLAFWICAIALVTCYVFVLKGAHGLEDEILSTLYSVTAFVLLPVACALLPYMYGKLICTSEFPTVIINTGPPNSAGAAPDSDSCSHKGLLIGQADKDYTVLTVNSGATQTQIYPEGAIRGEISTIPNSNGDVVAYVLAAKAMTALRGASPDQPCQIAASNSAPRSKP